MRGVGLVVAATLAGGLLVGPWLAVAAHRWIGWRVILPQMAGMVAPRSELGPIPRDAWKTARWVRPISVATAVVFGLAAWRLGWSAGLLPVLPLTAGMVAVSAVDLQCWRIPTRFVYTTAGVVLLGLVAEAIIDGERTILTAAVIGSGAYLVVLGGMHLVSPRMMGFGDVRLGALIGLVVGSSGWQYAELLAAALSWSLVGIFAASLLGTVAGAVVLVARRRARALQKGMWREPFPYGPWLCLGGYLTILLASP